ncbi:FAD-binding protein [Streptomonospora sp. S1-112]|uniref:FAD-binding protein n=1 Tax=Streptomonospora mangrovi TaxID=2883123 RepID=A0A9X3NKK6_9ACTN|nr:styrene monooxygenase/indole monooxygenase family protein [Streptomonospora mangrovi]MDA0565202.1 FAD-binding protein [Streptomonospora mangrovi]
MRIGIVGAGQSGLVLTHHLLARGIDVELFSQQTSEEMRRGRGVLAQITLPATLSIERAAGLDFWSAGGPPPSAQVAPIWDTVRLTAATTRGEVAVSGRLPGPAVAVDPRLKRADWLEYAEDRGASVQIRGVTVSDLEGFAAIGRYDLIVIAVGGGELGGIFLPDEARRTSHARARALSQATLHGVEPGPVEADVVSTPHGEILLLPVLSAEGPAHAVVLVGAPGGVLDAVPDPRRRRHTDIHAALLERLRVHAPGMWERCRGADVLDSSSLVHEWIRPAVRHPVGWLPSGTPVLGLGDTLVQVDPGSGQGWAASTLAAASLAEEIIARAGTGRPLDAEWMDQAFEVYWARHGRALSLFVDMVQGFHAADLDPRIQEAFAAAAADPAAADQWIASLDNPAAFADAMATAPT